MEHTVIRNLLQMEWSDQMQPLLRAVRFNTLRRSDQPMTFIFSLTVKINRHNTFITIVKNNLTLLSALVKKQAGCQINKKT